MTKTIRLIPNASDRVRYRLTNKPLRYSVASIAAAAVLATGLANGPSIATFTVEGWNGLQRTATASGPEQPVTERNRIDDSWVALIDQRATSRVKYAALDTTKLSAEDNTLISDYENAQTRADVLIENGTRDEEALNSATTELRNSLAAIEYVLDCETSGVACETG